MAAKKKMTARKRVKATEPAAQDPPAKRQKIRRAPGKPPPRGPGNPPWTGTTRAELVPLAARGLTMEQMADALQLDARTFFRHKAANPDIDKWIREGRGKGVAKVAGNLLAASNAGNIAATIFYLKARAGWRDQDAPTLLDPKAVAEHMAEMVKDMDKQMMAADGTD